jgi:hypothetical protein
MKIIKQPDEFLAQRLGLGDFRVDDLDGILVNQELLRFLFFQHQIASLCKKTTQIVEAA